MHHTQKMYSEFILWSDPRFNHNGQHLHGNKILCSHCQGRCHRANTTIKHTPRNDMHIHGSSPDSHHLNYCNTYKLALIHKYNLWWHLFTNTHHSCSLHFWPLNSQTLNNCSVALRHCMFFLHFALPHPLKVDGLAWLHDARTITLCHIKHLHPGWSPSTHLTAFVRMPRPIIHTTCTHFATVPPCTLNIPPHHITCQYHYIQHVHCRDTYIFPAM